MSNCPNPAPDRQDNVIGDPLGSVKLPIQAMA